MHRGLMASGLMLATLLGACDKQGAWGDANSIIVSTSPELWEQVQDTVLSTLEPRIRTVRNERMFQLTYQEAAGEDWALLRRFKQLLLVGTPEDPWMEEAVAALPSVPSPPALVQTHNVWARDQLVTLLLVPPSGQEEAVHARLGELRQLFERQYREWAVTRMFLSGRDTLGADSLRASAGFSLLLPALYRREAQDSVYRFRNDNPDPAELIREIAVTWRSDTGTPLDQESLLAWRSELTENHYSYPQFVDLTDSEARPVDVGGRPAFQLQAVWQNPPDANWPAAGPFIMRGVACPEQGRVYLLDAWLYAPGKQKYEYMIQLETILDSFRCGSGRAN